MNRFILLAALLLPFLAQAATAPVQVVIKSFAYGPAKITVAAGTAVVWVNKDTEPHTVVSTSHAFQSEAMDTGDTFSVTFDKPGTYGYFCTIHPHMTGTVEVTAK